eukprot:g14965.t1
MRVLEATTDRSYRVQGADDRVFRVHVDDLKKYKLPNGANLNLNKDLLAELKEEFKLPEMKMPGQLAYMLDEDWNQRQLFLGVIFEDVELSCVVDKIKKTTRGKKSSGSREESSRGSDADAPFEEKVARRFRLILRMHDGLESDQELESVSMHSDLKDKAQDMFVHFRETLMEQDEVVTPEALAAAMVRYFDWQRRDALIREFQEMRQKETETLADFVLRFRKLAKGLKSLGDDRIDPASKAAFMQELGEEFDSTFEFDNVIWNRDGAAYDDEMEALTHDYKLVICPTNYPNIDAAESRTRGYQATKSASHHILAKLMLEILKQLKPGELYELNFLVPLSILKTFRHYWKWEGVDTKKDKLTLLKRVRIVYVGVDSIRVLRRMQLKHAAEH